MTEQKRGAVCVGEVLIELARGSDGRFSLSCGGDTFNTAVYLARAGIEVAFASALGDDPYSDSIMDLAAAEGVSGELILRVPGRLAGALIENGPAGERSFRYWREGAPARDLFELPDWMRRRRGADVGAAHLFLRHHVVALFQHRHRAFSRRARSRAPAGRQDGVRRQFPSARLEGRSRAHPHRVHRGAQARRHRAADFRRRSRAVGRSPPEATVARLQAFGIGEIVVKNGPNSALVASAGAQEFVPVPEVMVPVDTMAAGDGFNAGYLAARLSGASRRNRPPPRTGSPAT